jgi:taurine dioxygenase
MSGLPLELRPLANVGVEVRGIDIGGALDEATRAALIAAWNEHGILLFRHQDVTPDKQIAFSKLFGPLEAHPLKATTSAEYPELFMLTNEPAKEKYMTASYAGTPIVGRLDWHIDLHYTGRPNRGAALRAVVCAETDGLTGFGDLAKAYAALDDATKTRLEGLEVAYSFSMQRRHMRFVDLAGYEPGPYSPRKPSDLGFPNFPDVAYPAVVTHPVTGQKVLEIVEQFLDRVVAPHTHGLSNDEAVDLLQTLVDHIRQPRFHYFHRWEPGDLVLWDNWRAMHCATGVAPGTARVIHRTTIMGDATLGRVLDA